MHLSMMQGNKTIASLHRQCPALEVHEHKEHACQPFLAARSPTAALTDDTANAYAGSSGHAVAHAYTLPVTMPRICSQAHGPLASI